MSKFKEIWEFNLDPEKLNKLSIADLLALEIYLGQRGEGDTNNYSILRRVILTKINELE